jgi:hypothetical protein
MPYVQKQRRNEWHGKDGFVNSKDSELNPEMLSGVRNLKDIAKRHCQMDIEQGNIL